MSISLIKYLERKRSSLKKFIEKNNISDYQEILDYCERRECDPISTEEFDLLVKPQGLQLPNSEPKIKEKEVQVIEKKESKPKRRRRTKVSRPAQKVQEKRSLDKAVKDS